MNNDVLVIGGGIAGMQAALLLAEKDHRVYVAETAPAIGGFFPLLDRQFPTNSCGVCFMSPKPPAYCPIYESEFHENIEIVTNSEVTGLSGKAGDFEATCLQRPRGVDVEKCNLCGKCAEVCPVEVEDELGGGIEKRKAVYMPFAQAIPRAYVIDANACTKCGKCVKVCSPGAIDLEGEPAEKKLKVGAVVLGFGFEPFRGEHKGEYGLGRYKNVLSSIQYERMLSFSGATAGIPTRPSDGQPAKKIAFIQCVGSRDMSCGKDYCSSVCCMYATKQAMMSKERRKDLDAAVFYMDIRAVGKDYERYWNRAKDKYGVRYLRSMVSTVRELKRENRMLISYAGADGKLKDEKFDIVVLSLGFTPPAGVKNVADRLGVALNTYGFCVTDELNPTQTSVPGIFVAGAFREPTDIPETVVQASSAAADVSALLDDFSAKDMPAVHQHKVPPRDPDEEEELRIGVFICDDKGALSEGLALDEISGGLANEGDDIVCVEKIDIGSLKDTSAAIDAKIAGNRLNRVILAGHKGIALSRTLKRSESGESVRPLFFHANIGEQCANVHTADPVTATSKAKGLLLASIRKARLAESRNVGRKQLDLRVLVIGGGIAGLSCSLSLAEQGMPVTLIEKDTELGGTARTGRYTVKGADMASLVSDMVSRAGSSDRINVMTGFELQGLTGTWGDFTARISRVNSTPETDSEEREAPGEAAEPAELKCGAVIFAAGGREATTDEYCFGQDERIVTQRQFANMLADNDPKAVAAENVVIIQCVGSRTDERPYCSRICCAHAVKNALTFKELKPDANVYVLNRDIRTYGFFEEKYRDARSQGVIFVRYEPSARPAVSLENGAVKVSFFDDSADDTIAVNADLLVLSTGIVPSEDNAALSALAGLDLTPDGFMKEANPKSAPLDSVDRGKYFCGLCLAPNFVEDVICQGKAAAARASALLWSGSGEYADNQAYVNERMCSGCGICVAACPYDARVIDGTSRKAVVLQELCKGCGTCVIACPNGASQQYDFERKTMFEVMDQVME